MDIMYPDLNNFSFSKPKVPDYSKVKDKPIIKKTGTYVYSYKTIYLQAMSI